MSFVPTLKYMIGLAFFGFVYWLFNNIMDELKATGISETGNVYDLLMYFWGGIVIVYIVFGGWWLVRRYNEREHMGGGW